MAGGGACMVGGMCCRGGGMCSRGGMCGRGGMHGREGAWWGCSWQGGMCGMHIPLADTTRYGQ